MAAYEDLTATPTKKKTYSAADQIPGSPYPAGYVAPPPQQPTFKQEFIDSNETGRNAYNALMAVPGAGAGVRAATALAGAARTTSKVASLATRVAAPAAPYAPVVGGAVALNNAASPPAAPAAGAAEPVAAPAAVVVAPSVQDTGNAQDTRLAQGMQTPTGVDASRVQLGTMQGQDIGAGSVRKFQQGSKTLYSNVESGADNASLLSGRPGVQVVPGQAQQPGQPVSGAATVPSTANADPALAAARLAAVDRGDIDAVKASYGGAFNDSGLATPPAGDVVTQLQRELANGKKLTAHGAQVLTAGLAQRAAAQQGAQASSIAAARLGLDAQTHSQDAALKATQVKAAQEVAAARAILLNAKTDDEKAAAVETLRALQGKYEKEIPDLFASVVVPGTTDTLGNKSPSTIATTDKRTGAVKITPAEATSNAAQPLPPKEQLVAGKTYQTARGPARWDGKTFTPVQ